MSDSEIETIRQDIRELRGQVNGLYYAICIGGLGLIITDILARAFIK